MKKLIKESDLGKMMDAIKANKAPRIDKMEALARIMEM